jgi:hypothetical protein
MLARGAADREEAGPHPPKYVNGDSRMLLFILIGIAWLAVLTLFAAICRAAAAGENRRTSADELRSASIGPKLVLPGSSER